MKEDSVNPLEAILFTDCFGADADDIAGAADEFDKALVIDNQGCFGAVGDKVRPPAIGFQTHRGKVEQAFHDAGWRAVGQLRRPCERGDGDPGEPLGR